jgi:hypothetical protein
MHFAKETKPQIKQTNLDDFAKQQNTLKQHNLTGNSASVRVTQRSLEMASGDKWHHQCDGCTLL